MFTGFCPGRGKGASFGQANVGFVEGRVSVFSSLGSGWRGVWRFLTAASGVGSLAVIPQEKWANCGSGLAREGIDAV